MSTPFLTAADISANPLGDQTPTATPALTFSSQLFVCEVGRLRQTDSLKSYDTDRIFTLNCICLCLHYQAELPVLLQELQPASTPLAVTDGSKATGASEEVHISPDAPESKGEADHVNSTCIAYRLSRATYVRRTGDDRPLYLSCSPDRKLPDENNLAVEATRL